MRYRLDVSDAIAEVWQWEGYWKYSFCYSDGSHHFSDSDWTPTERNAKEEAKALYQFRMHKKIGRARWIKTEN